MLCKSEAGKSRQALLQLDPRKCLLQGHSQGPLRLPLGCATGSVLWPVRSMSHKRCHSGVCGVQGCWTLTGRAVMQEGSLGCVMEGVS